MKYAAVPFFTGMLGACGGGDSEIAELTPENTDVILDPGVDPEKIINTPDGVTLDIDYLRQSISENIRCSVALGDVMIANAQITFYDVTGEVIGQAVTNQNGLAVTDIPARHMVAAEAITEYGTLYGMRFYVGDEYEPVLYVDILQSVFVELAKSIQNYLNISFFLIQDYFGLPHKLNILNIGHSYPAIDQRLMAEDWRNSNLTVENYVKNLANDIISKVDDHVYEDLRFNAHLKNNNNQRLLKNSAPYIDQDIFELVGSKVVETIGNAIPIPFASDLLKFGFGKLTDKIYPGNDSPFIAIQEKLNIIESKIDQHAKNYTSNEWMREREYIQSYFANIKELVKAHSKIYKHFEAFPNDENFVKTKQYNDYEKALLDLTDNSNKQIKDWDETKLNAAIDYLLGNNVGGGKIPLDILFDVLRLNKFYSTSGEDVYKGYLEYLIYNVSMGYLLLSTSISLRCIQENRSEYYCSEELKRLLSSYKEVKQRIKDLDVEKLPERVNIDYKKKLAWIGSCGLVKTVNDFWPPNRKACSQPSLRKGTLDGHSYYDVYSCKLTENGRGLDSWQGPDPKREMSRPDAHVSSETMSFGEWRSPKEDEFKEAFLSGLNKLTGISAHAASQGFSCVLKSYELSLNPFNNYPHPNDIYWHESLPQRYYEDGLAKIPTQYRRAGHAGNNGSHYYLDCTCFDLKNYSSASRNVRNNYGMNGTIASGNPSRYIFFPTCNVSDQVLAKHIPWIKLKRP